MDDQAPEFDDNSAFSTEQGLSTVLAALESNIELLTKFLSNHPEYQAIIDKLKALHDTTLEEQEKVFSESLGADQKYDKEPFMIKYYKHAYAQLDAMSRDPAWQSSAFLKTMQENLSDMLQNFRASIEEEDPTHVKAEQATSEVVDDELYTNVYVSLYCVSGELHDWEKILNNIDKQVISRPILTTEEHIKTLIRSKDKPRNQAYAVLRVLETNVIRQTTADRPDHDQLGHEMVSIKDTRIDKESIVYFVHENQIYEIEHGLLVAK